jgi:hypothetical protein
MANEFTARNGLIAQKDSVVTGSLIVTSGITGSLLGTASYAAQALSSSYASAYAAVFPYTGSAIISGSLIVTGSLTQTTTVTAASSNAVGATLSPTLSSSANNDYLVALDIKPSFSSASFTGTKATAIRIAGNLIPSGGYAYNLGDSANMFATVNTVNVVSQANLGLLAAQSMYLGANNGYKVGIFQATGNVTIGSTMTDAGYKLDVQGSTRFNGNSIITGSINQGGTMIASSAVARGSYLTPTLSASANNDYLVGVDIQPSYISSSYSSITPVGLRVTNPGGGVITIGQNTNFSFVNEILCTGRLDFGSTLSQLFMRGTQIYFVGPTVLTRTADASSTATQRSSYSFPMQTSLWTGTVQSLVNSGFAHKASTTVNLASRLAAVVNTTGTDLNTSGTEALTIFSPSANVLLAASGSSTFTDDGYRLDVVGTSRFNGNMLVTGSVTATSFTGSLLGTASYATQALSASFASTSSTTAAVNGTLNYIPVFTSANTLGISPMFQSSSNIGIGTIPQNGFRLDIGGSTVARGSILLNGSISEFSTNNYKLNTAGFSWINSGSGNFAIGTVIDSGYKFDVNGTSRFNGNMSITGSQYSLYFNYIYNPNAVATAAAKVQLVNAAGNSSVVSIASDSDSTDPSLLSIGGSNKGLELTSNSVRAFRIFDSTRNAIIQNGGTFVDAGYRLDVQGTMRVSGSSTAYGKSMVVQSGLNSVDFGQWDANNTGIWMDAIATTRTAANYTLLGGGGQTYLNAASGGALNLRIANTDAIRVTSTNTAFGSTNQSLIFTPTAGNPTLVQTGTTSSLMRTTSGTRNLQLESYSGDSNYLSANGASFTIRTTDSQNILFRTNNLVAGNISSAQNWNIGSNTDAGYKLDVTGTSRFSGNSEITGSLTLTGAISTGGQGYFAQGVWANIYRNLFGAEVYRITQTTNNLLLGATVDSGYRLDVSGSTRIRGYANTSISSSLLVYGSGSTNPVFSVQGSQGELFSVTDSLSGSLFSVNDISGLPVLEAFSDNTVLLGSYQAPALLTTNKIVLTASGNFTLSSLPTASYDGAFYDYTIRSGSNARAGTIMAIWSGSSVNFTETTTLDFGSTTGLNLGVFVIGGNMVLTGSASTTAWTIKTIIRSI